MSSNFLMMVQIEAPASTTDFSTFDRPPVARYLGLLFSRGPVVVASAPDPFQRVLLSFVMAAAPKAWSGPGCQQCSLN